MGNIFAASEVVEIGIQIEKKAIDIGIQAEKDSIVFYGGMKKVIPEYGQKVIDEVIAQEEDHLKKLLDLKAMP